MIVSIVSPIRGVVTSLVDIPDPVFAQGIVGPGLAIAPELLDDVKVLAPIDGVIVKIHPHAFVVQASNGQGVLIHLGLDTVQLNGEGFTVNLREGEQVSVGQHVLSWSPKSIAAKGFSVVVPIIAMQGEPDSIHPQVDAGDWVDFNALLFNWA